MKIKKVIKITIESENPKLHTFAEDMQLHCEDEIRYWATNNGAIFPCRDPIIVSISTELLNEERR